MLQSQFCGKYQECPDDIVNFEKLTVKFQISGTQTVAQTYPNCMTIAEIKTDLGRKFEVDPGVLIVCQDGKEAKDDLKLQELSKNEFGIVETYLKIDEEKSKKKRFKLDPQIYYRKHKLPDFITVNIPNEKYPLRGCINIIVEIQNLAIKKPFLGRHRDRRTGKVYFDAATQTGPPLERIKYSGIYSKETQTQEFRSKASDTRVDHSTQIFGDAMNFIYVPSVNDYVIQPKPYVSYKRKKKRENKIGKIILIQRNLRRYILWKFIREAAAEYRRLQPEQERRDNLITENEANKVHKECVVNTFPKTKEDFDLLFAQIQRWKDGEIKRINSMHSGGSRLAELNCLLDKEIQLLNGVEKQRSLVRKALKDFRDEQQLNKLGEPVKWAGYQNLVVEVDLLRTQRVRYLTDLYKAWREKSTKSDRLNLINKICQVFQKEADQKPGLEQTITELLDLFEREKSLLICTKMNDCTLDTLRKRQGVLFLEIIQYVDEQKSKNADSKMCEKCKTVKHITNFALRTRQSSVDVCKNCHYMRGSASDNSLYKAIIRSIQRDGKKCKTLASYAFIIQEDDVRFIIHKIWRGHSILSKCDDLAKLRLPRWEKNEDWSPWNCVCLTEAEARAHDQLHTLSEVYHETTIQDIQSKHLLAKSAFKKLVDVDNDFVNPGHWWRAGIHEKVL